MILKENRHNFIFECFINTFEVFLFYINIYFFLYKKITTKKIFLYIYFFLSFNSMPLSDHENKL